MNLKFRECRCGEYSRAKVSYRCLDSFSFLIKSSARKRIRFEITFRLLLLNHT